MESKLNISPKEVIQKALKDIDQFRNKSSKLLESLTQKQFFSKEIANNFFQGWFEHQKDLLQEVGLLENYSGNFVEHCWVYTRAVALKFKEINVTEISFEDDFSFDDEIEKWRRFFGSDNLTSLMVLACPWEVKDGYTLSLHDKGVVNYFAGLTQYDLKEYLDIPFIRGDEGIEELSELLDREVLAGDGNQLRHLVADIQMGDISKEDYFRLVYLSVKSEKFSPISANAITILNYARVSFSGMDLSGIKIPNADLSNAVCFETNFSEANLSNVKFIDAYLGNADVRDSYAAGIKFGKLPNLDGHRSPVNCMAISPNNRYLISSGSLHEKNHFRVWDLSDYSSILLKMLDFKITGLCFFSDSNRFMLAGENNKYVEIWSLIETRCISKISHEFDNLTSVLVSPNGKWLALSGLRSGKNIIELDELDDDKNIKYKDYVFNQKQGLELYTKIVFSPDSNYLTVSIGQILLKKILLFDIVNQFTVIKIKPMRLSDITAINFSHDNESLIFIDKMQLYFWNISKNRIIYKSNCDEKLDRSFCNLAMFTTQPWLAFSDMRGYIYIWDFSRNTLINSFEAHNGLIKKLFIIENDKRFVSAGRDGLIKLWPIDQITSHVSNERGHRSKIAGLIVDHDNKILISAGSDGKLYLWNTQNGEYYRELGEHSLDVNCLSLSSDNKLASVSADGIAMVWNLNNLKKEFEFICSKYEVNCIQFSPDNKIIGTAGFEGVIALWDAHSGSKLWELKPELNSGDKASSITALEFSPNGKYLISANDEDEILLWELASRKTLKQKKKKGESISCIDFSPDGIHFAVGDYDNDINFYRLEGDTFNNITIEKYLYTSHYGEISSVKFSPDGQFLASAGHDGKICLWRTSDQKIVFFIRGDGSAVTSLSFSSDGKRLFSGHWNSSIKAWDLVEFGIKLKWSVHHQLSAENIHYESMQGLDIVNQALLKQIVQEGNGISFYLDIAKFLFDRDSDSFKSEAYNAFILTFVGKTANAHRHNQYNIFEGWLLAQAGLIFSKIYYTTRPRGAEIAFDLLRWKIETIFYENLEMRNKSSNQWVRMLLKYKQDVKVNVERESDGATPLLLAISSGDIRSIKYLLHCGADVNYVSKRGDTPIHLVIYMGAFDILFLLHEWGGDLTKITSTKAPPIYYAVFYNHLHMLQYLVSQSVDPLHVKYKGQRISLLPIASTYGHFDIVRYLVEYKAPLNEQDEAGNTALLNAIFSRHEEIARYLIEHGSDPTLANLQGATPLIVAVQFGAIALVELLLPYENDINKILPNGLTLFLQAIVFDQLAVMHLLVDRGASPTKKSSDGLSAMDLGALRSSVEVVRFLCQSHSYSLNDQIIINYVYKMIKNNKISERYQMLKFLVETVENKNYRDPDTGETFLISIINTGFTDLVSYLLRQGASPNLPSSTGDTPLIHAAERGYEEIVKLLCQNQADVNLQQREGFTALMSAAQNGKIEAVRYLLTVPHIKTNLATYNFGTTALHSAVRMGHLSILVLLLKHGINRYQTNFFDDNILHIAVVYGHNDIVNYIVEEVEDFNMDKQNKEGFSPIMCAACKDNIQIFKYLQGRGAKLDPCDHNGNNLLKLTFLYKAKGILEYLVENGYMNALQQIVDQYSFIIRNVNRHEIVLSQLPSLHEIVDKMRECCDVAYSILADNYLRLAIRHKHSNDLTSRVQYIEKALQILPNHPAGNYQKAQYLFEVGDYKKALVFIEKSLLNEPVENKKGHSYRLRAQIHFAMKNYDLAEIDAALAFSLRPEDSELEVLLSKIASENSMNSSGAKNDTFIKQMESNDIFSRSGSSGELFDEKNTQNAYEVAKEENLIEQFERKLLANPQEVKLHLILAGLYYNHNDLEKSIFHYQMAVNFLEGDDAANANHNLACLYHVRGDVDLADEHFKLALVYRTAASTYCDYGLLLYKQKRFKEAIENFLKAISIGDDKSGLGYGNLEQVRLDNFLQQDIQTYGDLNVKPLFMAYYWIIRCYHELKQESNREEKLNEFRQLVESTSELIYRRLLIYTYEYLGRTQQAEESRELLEALEMSVNADLESNAPLKQPTAANFWKAAPQTVEDYLSLAIQCKVEKNEAQRILFIDKALELSANDSAANYEKARYFFEHQNYHEALKFIEIALNNELNENKKVYPYKLRAQIYFELHNLDLAQEDIALVLSVNPEDKEVEELLRKIEGVSEQQGAKLTQ